MRTVESIDPGVTFDLDAVRAVLRDYPVRLTILFGSHATGEAHGESDIDIAVEFENKRPSDPTYNEVFFGLSADISDTLETDDVDVVDLHSTSPAVAESIFESGVLLVGEQEHAAELRRQLTTASSDQRSPKERLDAALGRIDAHLETEDDGVPVTGNTENER